MSRDFPTPSNFMVWTPTWTGWLRGTHGLDLVWNFLTAGNWYLRRAVKLLVVRAFDILALRLLFPQGKWIFFHLFEFPLTNMAKATYQNIRKLCSSVFSRKQTLKFAPATMASCDASIQLLFSGDSTSLRAQTVETRSVYWLQPMSVGKMNADYFKSLNYEVQK